MKIWRLEIKWHKTAKDTFYTEIRALCDANERIRAIKLYREKTGAYLKDAVVEVAKIAPPSNK